MYDGPRQPPLPEQRDRVQAQRGAALADRRHAVRTEVLEVRAADEVPAEPDRGPVDVDAENVVILVRRYKAAAAKNAGGAKTMRLYNDLKRLVRQMVADDRRKG